MLIIRLIRFLTGYVIFSGSGGFPERFLNLCSSSGIHIWDAKAAGGVLTAKTSIQGYKNIRPCARNSGMRVRISKKCGLPFLLKPYKHRKGLLAGIALSVLLLFFLNSAVWLIQVDGNEKFTQQQILSLAEERGIHIGAFKKNIDIKEIREDIKAKTDGINWFSVNLDGSCLSLVVAENSGSDEIYDRETPCNILSTVDGELLQLDAYEGKAEVTPGSAVLKGDLLINGATELADGTPKFVHARGIAIVRTNRTLNAEIALTIPAQELLPPQIHRSVLFFGVNIPLGAAKEGEASRIKTQMLRYEQAVLPIGLQTETTVCFTTSEKQLSQHQALLLCGYSLFLQETEIMKNAETEQKEIRVRLLSDSITAEIRYINHETTGLEQLLEIESE